jgi:hypothetical protein
VSTPAAVYRPRNPQSSDYYRCVEDHFETFIQVYEERFVYLTHPRTSPNQLSVQSISLVSRNVSSEEVGNLDQYL